MKHKSEQGKESVEVSGVFLLALFVVFGAFLLFQLITGINLFQKAADLFRWLFFVDSTPTFLGAGLLYAGWTPSITLAEKAKNLSDRLRQVDGNEKTKETVAYMLDKWGDVNTAFVRDLSEYVMDVEQEAYS